MSVRKRTWKGPKGETKEAWVVDYVDGAGQRRLKTFTKKKEADAFSANARVEVVAGVHVPDRDTVTVKEAGELWLASGSEAGLERSSIDQREQHLRLHIVPLIGGTKLNKIGVPAVRAFQDELRDKGRSPAMVKRITVSLGSIFADAQSRGLTVRNPVHEASRARSSAKGVEKRGKRKLLVGVDIPTTEEVKAMLSGASGMYRPFLLIATFAGLRASEIRGLRWSDVDLDARQLHVRQRADRYGVVGMPKSDAGQRSLSLIPLVVNALKEWKLACPANELGLVFPAPKSGRILQHHVAVVYGLVPAMLAGGVTVEAQVDGEKVLAAKYTGLHALRHWFASWCINPKSAGGLELTPKAVQERLGHSSIVVTLDTYGHLFPTPDEHAELALAEERLFAVRAT